MKATKAFTLIELLVVIAIIAILAAILFPVFAQAKAAAKSAVSVSNMKQIGLGLAMYEGDADDVMPLGRVYGSSGNIGLPVLLGPYIQKVANKASGDTTPVSKETIWHSPLDSVAPQSYTFTPTAGSPFVKQTYDHIYSTTAAGRAAWDSDITDNNGQTYYQPGKSATVFGAPANTFVIAESLMPSLILGANNPGIKRPWDPESRLSDYAGSKEGNGDYLGQDCNALNGTDTSCAAVLNRKTPTGIDSGGGWNYLFADSHVKSMKPTATVGTGVNGTGKDANGNTCGARFPCGPWTVDDSD